MTHHKDENTPNRRVTSGEDYIMRKRGLFYRPGCLGYTSDILEAGAYPKEFVEKYCNGLAHEKKRGNQPTYHKAKDFFGVSARRYFELLTAAKAAEKALAFWDKQHATGRSEPMYAARDHGRIAKAQLQSAIEKVEGE